MCKNLPKFYSNQVDVHLDCSSTEKKKKKGPLFFVGIKKTTIYCTHVSPMVFIIPTEMKSGNFYQRKKKEKRNGIRQFPTHRAPLVMESGRKNFIWRMMKFEWDEGSKKNTYPNSFLGKAKHRWDSWNSFLIPHTLSFEPNVILIMKW